MLMQFRGDKKGWPVYITIGNIPSKTRRQPSKNAMKLLGYLPNANFAGYTQDVQSVKRQQLYHKCMRELLNPIMKAEAKGV